MFLKTCFGLTLSSFLFSAQAATPGPAFAHQQIEQLNKLINTQEQACLKETNEFAKLGDKVPTGIKDKKDTLFINKDAFKGILAQLKDQNETHLQKIKNIVKNMQEVSKKEIDSIAQELTLYSSNCNRVIRDTKAKIEKQKTSKWQVWK